jgi:superfamily I DNA and/or RNA helicase
VIAEAKVVAATFSKVAVDQSIATRSFDIVVIDEASAAPVPLVAWALTRATTSATVLGDFLQNSPIYAATAQTVGRLDPAMSFWLSEDVFSTLGINTPDRASAHPGCVVLRKQYRFAAAITELANTIAYDGTLESPTDIAALEDGLGAVVVVDTSGLHYRGEDPQLPSGKRWWATGLAVTSTLLDHHVGDGNAIGVVTPYRDQAELHEAMLRDRTDELRVEAGTAHRFQGREFPIVIFDTVQGNQASRGWMANANLQASLTIPVSHQPLQA